MIIEGTVDTGEGPEAFVYRSRDNDEQRASILPNLVLSEESSEVRVSFLMDTGQWFQGSLGAVLDPREPANADLIEENIENSIDIFEDDDEDGRRDD